MKNLYIKCVLFLIAPVLKEFERQQKIKEMAEWERRFNSRRAVYVKGKGVVFKKTECHPDIDQSAR